MVLGQRFRLVKGFLVLILIGMLSACAFEPKISSSLTTGSGDISAAAAAQTVMTNYLIAWQDRDYAEMYGLISTLSQDAISLESFENEYQKAANHLTLEALEFQVLSTMAERNHAEVAFGVDFTTHLIGDMTRSYIASLTFEFGNWRIQWKRGLILPELKDGSELFFVHQAPSRGRIFAQNGEPLAAYEDAIALGIVPGEILPQQAELVYATLAELSVYEPEGLQALVESTPADWYLPVVTLSKPDVTPYMDTLRNLQGVRIGEFRSRFYVDGGVAPHAVGYMLYIPEEDLDIYLEQGYSKDERVGAAGLEAVFEEELSGTRGGALYVVDQDGKIQTLLTASDPVPGQSLFTTINKPLQMRLQASLGDLRAAVVVMEVDTGRVLALVSNPDFDPNAFDLNETDRSLLDSYFTDENKPLINRATQGQYPLGSVFKPITMSTALETGLYRATSSFNCGHSLWVCDSVTLYDWTYTHGTASSGELTLPEGLMCSCNPWFYRIGENLFIEGQEDALSDMAYGFGLGAETGIEIPEASGHIPDTAGTCVNNAQMAIGQGEILVTPLQVTAYYAAIANDGTIYQPSLVESIKSASGETTYAFSPEPTGTLPLSPENLATVQEALRMVIEEPRGTGYWAMQGLDVPVSGKTGTAQTPSGSAHAWFAGYTRQNDPDRPDIAVVVIVENGGEGSVMAAPVFRRAVSLYFSDMDDPGGVMPWEVEPYITETPAPTPTPTSEE